MNHTPKTRYKTINWPSYNRSLINRGNITIWFDPKTQWYAEPKGKQGRNQTYSDTAIQCCLMIKSLFRLSLRMVTGFVQNLIKLSGLNWTAPDYSTLTDLLDQIPSDEAIHSVYGDGAYDTKQCRKAISDRQAHAVIPPRKNAKPWKDTHAYSQQRNEQLKTMKYLGRTIWKKWSGYHRRSLVESKMLCIKLLGDKLSARNFDSQVNEIHARVAVLNRFTELGRPLTRVTP